MFALERIPVAEMTLCSMFYIEHTKKPDIAKSQIFQTSTIC